MKTRIILLITFLGVLFFPSCYDPTDNEYSRQKYETEVPFSDWKLEYQYAGVLNTPIDGITNVLVGTKWVLTEYRVVPAGPIQYSYDTIEFITNRTYTINNGGIRSYNLFSSPAFSLYELELDYFFPFGGSHYSAQIGQYSVDDGEINTTFIDLQNSDLEIIAYFTKIN